MPIDQPLTKRELMRQIRRFLKDQKRGISTKLFAELCGIDRAHLLDVFIYRVHSLTEYIQRRVDKGYKAWQRGEVAIMQNRDNTKFVQYRREAKPRMTRSTSLQMVNGEIKIKVGVINRGDYSAPTLDEQLERG